MKTHKLITRNGILDFCNSLVGSKSSYYWKYVNCKKCLNIGNKVIKNETNKDKSKDKK